MTADVDAGRPAAIPSPVPTGADGDYFDDVLAGMPEESRRVIAGLKLVGSVYVSCGRDDALLVGFNRFLERYIATRGTVRDEADFYFLVGESGAGKTAAIGRLLREHAGLRPRRTAYGPAPRYVSIKLKGYTHPRLVGRQIIRASGYGLDAKLERGEVWDGMAGILKAQGVFLVHVDEAQHMLRENAPKAERDELANAFKGVAIDTDWPVVFVLTGLPDVLRLPLGDTQVERRENVTYFEGLRMPDERDLVIHIVERMSEAVGIEAGHLSSTDLPDRLARAARRQYARICQLVEGALQEAMHYERSALTVGHFAAAYDRRVVTLGDDDNNIFTARYWESMQPRAFLPIEDEEARSR